MNALKNENMLSLQYDFRLGAVGAKRIEKITSSVRYRPIVDYRPVLNNISYVLNVVNLQMLLRKAFFRDVRQLSEYFNEISKYLTEAMPGNFYGLCLVYTENVRAKGIESVEKRINCNRIFVERNEWQRLAGDM